jgi:hypothetical protein
LHGNELVALGLWGEVLLKQNNGKLRQALGRKKMNALFLGPDIPAWFSSLRPVCSGL